MRLTPAATDGPTLAMKQTQLHFMPVRHVPKALLRTEEGPVGGKISAVFHRIGIPQHDFLEVAARLEQFSVNRILQKLIQNAGAGLQVVDGFKQRDGVETRLEPAATVGFHQPCLPASNITSQMSAARAVMLRM